MADGLTSIRFLLFALGVASFFITKPAVAARHDEPYEVLYVSAKGYYVVVSGGARDRFAEGDNVCLYGEGSDEEPVTCGPVIRTKRTVSAVLVGAEDIGKVQVGMMSSKQKSGKKKRPRRSWDDSLDKSLDESLSQVEGMMLGEDELSPQGRLPMRRALDVYYLYTPLLPYQYAYAAFNVYSRIKGVGTLWNSDKAVKSSAMGLGVAYIYDIPDTTNSFNPSLYMRLMPGDQHDVDFDPSNPQVYNRAKTLVSNYGVNLDIMERLGDGIGAWQNAAILGFGLDVSQLSFTATAVDESTGTRTKTASAKSQLLMAVLRGGFASDYHWGAMKIGGRILGILPIVAQQTISQPGHDLPSDTPTPDRSKNDLQDAIAHQKRAFGLEATLNIGMVF